MRARYSIIRIYDGDGAFPSADIRERPRPLEYIRMPQNRQFGRLSKFEWAFNRPYYILCIVLILYYCRLFSVCSGLFGMFSRRYACLEKQHLKVYNYECKTPHLGLETKRINLYTIP